MGRAIRIALLITLLPFTFTISLVKVNVDFLADAFGGIIQRIGDGY